MKSTVSINKNHEFAHVYKKGKYYIGKYIILHIVKGFPDSNRLGVTASRKVGKSVVRNRMRRLVKENYRFYEPYIFLGLRLVFVIRGVTSLPTYQDVNREMKSLFKRAGVLDVEKWEKRQSS